MSYILPDDCPTGCSNEPAQLSFDACSPEVIYGNIGYIYMRAIGNPMTDWTSGTEWSNNISNTSTASDAIRVMHVIGSMAEPETSETDISLGRKSRGLSTYTVNFTIDETNDTNYEAMRFNDCNGNYLFWFETTDNTEAAGKLYGGANDGNAGIKAFIKSSLVISEDPGVPNKIVGTITWKSRFAPNRITSPITHS